VFGEKHLLMFAHVKNFHEQIFAHEKGFAHSSCLWKVAHGNLLMKNDLLMEHLSMKI
jgi:hypothetical protein